MANSAYSIDTHKLIYHVDRVNRWLKGENIYPIYIEAAPAGGCNQRCVFCGLDYTGHKAKFLNTQCWQTFVKQAAKRGLRSVLFAGEGEPLLNKDINIFVESSKLSGIDTAIATNAFLLSNDLAKVILKNLTWIRVSLDAATAKVYSKIHGVNPEQFSIVLNNLSSAVELKKKYKYPVTIGVQFLLLKENYNDVLKAAAICRDLGADYFSVKPYSKHPLSLNEAGTEVDYSKWMSLEDKLMTINSDSFKIVFRKGAMARKTVEKPYKRCLGLPFWAYVDAGGDVYPCSTFLGMKKYSLGNICQGSFSSIWEGEKRKKVMAYFSKMDARKCRELCRLDEINAYLWNLKNPSEHINFI